MMRRGKAMRLLFTLLLVAFALNLAAVLIATAETELLLDAEDAEAANDAPVCRDTLSSAPMTDYFRYG